MCVSRGTVQLCLNRKYGVWWLGDGGVWGRHHIATFILFRSIIRNKYVGGMGSLTPTNRRSDQYDKGKSTEEIGLTCFIINLTVKPANEKQ